MSHHPDPYYLFVFGTSIILFISSLLYLLAKKIRVIPFPVFLLIAGFGLRFIHIPALEAVRLTPGMVMFAFLPILLFESAYHFELRDFRRILTPAFLLATLGLLISSIIVALPLVWFLDVPWTAAWLYGCVISSTDPIAVLSIFKQLGVPKKLQLFVDAESFLNDGTSVIMFRILVSVQAGIGLVDADFSPELVFNGLGNFIYVIFGGIIVGAMLAWMFAQILSPIHNNKIVETVLTIVLAPFVFILSDHFLGVSGIIAVLAAGIIIGNYGKVKISPKVVDTMTDTWELLAFISVAMVFLLIGYEVDLQQLLTHMCHILIALAALLVGRSVSVYGIVGLYNKLRTNGNRFPLSWLHITNIGGLRGALPLVMILTLPESFTYRELFIDMTLGAVLFTLLINALLTAPLIRRLGIDSITHANRIETKIMEVIILEKVLRLFERMKQQGKLHDDVYNKRTTNVLQTLDAAKAQIEEWSSGRSSDAFSQETERILKRFALQSEKNFYRDLHDHEIIHEGIYVPLKHSLDFQLDRIDQGIPERIMPDHTVSLAEELDRVLHDRLSFSAWLQALFGHNFSRQVRDTYLYHLARILGDKHVIEELKLFSKLALPSFSNRIVDTLISEYENLASYNQHTLTELASKFPDAAYQVEQELGECESDSLIVDLVEKFGEEERISPKALQALDLKI